MAATLSTAANRSIESGDWDKEGRTKAKKPIPARDAMATAATAIAVYFTSRNVKDLIAEDRSFPTE
jgi:hypothetical protein